jgi:threonine dehydrogenase-like Zn-dependent dehydrogenase
VTTDSVLIKVACAGICGTDLAIVAGKHPRATPPPAGPECRTSAAASN